MALSAGSPSSVYLNHAACGLASVDTLSAIQKHLTLEASIGGYVAAERVQAELTQGYAEAATLLSCQPNEIAFTDSGTRAWHRALESVALKAGDVVLASPMIWGGNFFTLLRYAERLGIEVKAMPSLENGEVDLTALKPLLTKQVKLIELCQAGSGWDNWQPPEKICELAQQANIPVLIDACQSLGQKPIDVKKLGCTFLVASGRKWLRGPRGTGVMYINHEWSDKHGPLGLDQHAATFDADGLDLAANARPFDLGECSIALRLGLTTALTEANLLLHTRPTVLIEKGQTLRQKLSVNPNVLLGPAHPSTGAIVTFTHKTLPPLAIKNKLQAAGIEVNVHPASFMPLHLPTQLRGDSIRISPHHMTDDQQLDHACDVLLSLL